MASYICLSFQNPFGKTSIPIGGRQQSHSISINIGCVTQFLTSRNFWKCTNFTHFPPHLHSAVSWPSQTVNYMMNRGLILTLTLGAQNEIIT